MSEELKPCPFCGESKAITTEETLANGLWASLCDRCGACGPVCEDKLVAIQQWNERKASDEG